MTTAKDYWCENELTTIRNRLDYKLLYIANKASLDYVKEYLSYFGESRVNQKIKEYIDNGCLKIATNKDKLSILPVTDLKEILKVNSLKVSGKKAELIDRIKDSIPEEKYKIYLPCEKYIVRTDKGEMKYKEFINSENIILYDIFEKVATFILKSDYRSAEILSQRFYQSNHFKYRGINQSINVGIVLPNGLKEQLIDEYGQEIYAALVANDYIGATVDINIINLFLKNCDIDTEFTKQTWSETIAYYCNLRYLFNYKNSKIKSYTISTANDDKTCSKCKSMNGKKFRISECG